MINPLEKLCYYDERNPDHPDKTDYDYEFPEPRDNCACSNCFYGRDAMALEMIAQAEALRIADRLLGKTLKYLATSSGVGSNGLRAEVLKHLEATEGGE